jgi:hypothetical protein
MRWAGLLILLAGCATAPPPLEPPPKLSPAERNYRQAEQLYQAGDFIGSQIQCERALREDPFHAPSKALHSEVKRRLGEGHFPATVLAQARLDKVEACLEEGRRHLFLGNLFQARLLATLAHDLAQTLPPEMDIELRVAQAQAILDWAEAFRE